MSDLQVTADTSQVKSGTNDLKKFGKELNNISNNMSDQRAASRAAQRAFNILNDAVVRGTISTTEYHQALKLLRSEAVKANVAVNQFEIVTDRNTQSMKRFASVGLQQVGYQLGDFAVQVQGGTNAAVAFGQQGSQLLGILGPFGAILGAVLAVTTAFVAPLLDTGKAMKEAGQETQKLTDYLGTLRGVIQPVSDAFTNLKETAIDAVNLVVNNLDRLLVYAGTVAAFFGGRLVASFVAAQVAAASLSGTLLALRTALMRLVLPAIILGIGELVYQFTRVVEAVGSVGEALRILKDILSFEIDRMARVASIGGEAIGFALSQGISAAVKEGLEGISDMFGNFIGRIASGVGQMSQFMPALKGPEQALSSFAEQLKGFDAGGYDLGDVGVFLESSLESIKSILGETNPAFEELKEAIAAVKRPTFDLRDLLGGLEEAEEATGGATEDLTEELKNLSDYISNTLVDAFRSVVDGTKTMGNALLDFVNDVLMKVAEDIFTQNIADPFSQAASTIISGLFPGTYANGGVFNNGQVTPFASGGIVGSPTIFPMANGMGLMGEAGPEAIMPLKRNSKGALGVEASGGGTPVVVNIRSEVGGQPEVTQTGNGLDIFIKAVAADITQNGPVSRAISKKYTVNKRLSPR